MKPYSLKESPFNRQWFLKDMMVLWFLKDFTVVCPTWSCPEVCMDDMSSSGEVDDTDDIRSSGEVNDLNNIRSSGEVDDIDDIRYCPKIDDMDDIRSSPRLDDIDCITYSRGVSHDLLVGSYLPIQAPTRSRHFV